MIYDRTVTFRYIKLHIAHLVIKKGATRITFTYYAVQFLNLAGFPAKQVFASVFCSSTFQNARLS
jgi:hypothetical protein